MKKQFVLFGIYLIIGSSIFLLVRAVNDQERQSERQMIMEQTFPAIELTSLNGDQHNTKVLLDSAIFKVLVLFDPECDHCREEFNDISANIDKFHRAVVLFISPKSLPDLKLFAFDGKYPEHQKFIYNIGYDELLKYFKCKAFPETYIYNKAGKLIKSFRGRIDSNKILSLITV